MPRSRKTAKVEGARFERQIADHFKSVLEDDRIDRRTRNGNKDRGDIAGVTINGQRLVIECKNAATMKTGPWLTETETERGNDDALAGILITKRHGKTQPGKQIVTMEVDELLAILTGSRSHIDGA